MNFTLLLTVIIQSFQLSLSPQSGFSIGTLETMAHSQDQSIIEVMASSAQDELIDVEATEPVVIDLGSKDGQGEEGVELILQENESTDSEKVKDEDNTLKTEASIVLSAEEQTEETAEQLKADEVSQASSNEASQNGSSLAEEIANNLNELSDF